MASLCRLAVYLSTHRAFRELIQKAGKSDSLIHGHNTLGRGRGKWITGLRTNINTGWKTQVHSE